MFTVVNYGVGNLGSISNMLNYLGILHRVSAFPEDIETADHLLLPGVGAFDFGMAKLNDSGLTSVLNQRVLEDSVPILGICLGMQIMCRQSEEGVLPGLGWFDAEVKRFDPTRMDMPRPVPHMGWNEVVATGNHAVLNTVPKPARFYFVHSYHVVCDLPEDELLFSHYGYDFTAGVAHKNRVAVQFHPEKSHKFGLALLANFAKWTYVSA